MPHRLHELGPQHYTAIRMRLDGASTDEICETLDVEKRTVYIWFSDPLVKAELSRQLARINEIFVEKLASTATTAIDQLKEMVEMPVQGPLTPETKLKVVREILDRAAGGASIGGRQDGIFSELSTDELLDIARVTADIVNTERPASD
jgi:AcrR family transcriptional regulator